MLLVIMVLLEKKKEESPMDHNQTGICLQNVVIVNKHPHFLTLKAKILVERDGPIIKNMFCSSVGSRLGPSTTCRLRTGWNWL